jgi:hypothetical protein
LRSSPEGTVGACTTQLKFAQPTSTGRSVEVGWTGPRIGLHARSSNSMRMRRCVRRTLVAWRKAGPRTCPRCEEPRRSTGTSRVFCVRARWDHE